MDASKTIHWMNPHGNSIFVHASPSVLPNTDFDWTHQNLFYKKIWPKASPVSFTSPDCMIIFFLEALLKPRVLFWKYIHALKIQPCTFCIICSASSYKKIENRLNNHQMMVPIARSVCIYKMLDRDLYGKDIGSIALMFYCNWKENSCILWLHKLYAANAHFEESLRQNAQLYFQTCDCITVLFQPASYQWFSSHQLLLYWIRSAEAISQKFNV